MKPAATSGGEDGFTLVEMLVAFAIVALGTVMAIELASALTQRDRRIAAIVRAADEAQAIVMLRFAAGTLRPGEEAGRFSDGRPWALGVADVGQAFGWRNVPPVWHVRLRRDGPRGPIVYETVLAASLGG